MSVGRLPDCLVLFVSFEGCCILTSGVDLSDDPSLPLSSDNPPSSSLPFTVVVSLAFTFLSFSSLLPMALVFRFCFPFGSLDSLESLLGADSHLFGMTTLIISSLIPSGNDLFFSSVFLLSSSVLCSFFFGSVIFRVVFPVVSELLFTRLSAVHLDLLWLSFPPEHVLLSLGGLTDLAAPGFVLSAAPNRVFTVISVLAFRFRVPLLSCLVVLVVTFLILLFVGRLLAKLVVTVSQLDGLSGVTGVVSLPLLSR